MSRLFVYEGNEYPDPDTEGKMPVDEVRQSMANFFPELANSEVKETKRGEDTIYTFARRVGTKGSRWHPETAEERFWKKVEKTETCWIWTGAKSELGYGRFISASGVAIPAHRFSYELINGKVPEGLELDHLCRNPSCVNPAHLEAVTHSVNLTRGLTGKVKNPSTSKTCCPKGHPYDETNTYHNNQGRRECRTCHRERARDRRGSIARRRSPYYAGAAA